MENFKIRAGDLSIESNAVFSYPIHTHTYCEMTLYFPFDGIIAVNNQEICVNKITAILVKPYDSHKIDVKSDYNAKFIKIIFDENSLIKENVPETSFKLSVLSDNDFLVTLFEEAYAQRNEKVYFKSLINAIVCRITMYGEKINNEAITAGYKVAEKAIKIINEHFCSAISLQSVAKMLYITPQYLSHVFKTETGIGFAEYVVRMRLGKAAVMLRDTSDSITEICYMCGYKNLSHFLRSFKKEYGLSPNSYRKYKKYHKSL